MLVEDQLQKTRNMIQPNQANDEFEEVLTPSTIGLKRVVQLVSSTTQVRSKFTRTHKEKIKQTRDKLKVCGE